MLNGLFCCNSSCLLPSMKRATPRQDMQNIYNSNKLDKTPYWKTKKLPPRHRNKTEHIRQVRSVFVSKGNEPVLAWITATDRQYLAKKIKKLTEIYWQLFRIRVDITKLESSLSVCPGTAAKSISQTISKITQQDVTVEYKKRNRAGSEHVY